MLVAKEIYKTYNQEPLLRGVNLSLHRGEMVAIMGASGTGKTTLLHILSTLDRPDSGSIILDGIELTKLRGAALAECRNKKIGFVFQFHNLLPELTLFENICLPGYIGSSRWEAVARRANALIDQLGLVRQANALPVVVSGGERQRAAIARALINEPAILFADEPTGSLDEKNGLKLQALFLDLCNHLQQNIVFVTHNPSFASMAHKMLVLRDGLLQAT